VRHLLAGRLSAADLLLQFADALAQHGDLLSLKRRLRPSVAFQK
jgi:hypothetical protein